MFRTLYPQQALAFAVIHRFVGLITPLSAQVKLVARGVSCHSAFPELGISAIDTLVTVLHDIHQVGHASDVGAAATFAEGTDASTQPDLAL